MTDNIQIVLQQDQNGNYIASSNSQDQNSIQNFLNTLQSCASAAVEGIIRTAEQLGVLTSDDSLVKLTKKSIFVFNVTTGLA